MADPRAREPGPEHPITVAPNPRRVVVTYEGQVIADSRQALTLREASYPPVQYIPRTDVDMARLRRSAHASYCPYKGDCAYFDLPGAGAKAANAVWTYETPYPAVAEIAGRLAFYSDRVRIEEVD